MNWTNIGNYKNMEDIIKQDNEKKEKKCTLKSLDLSQAEKKIIVAKAEWIHKMTIIFTQNDYIGLSWVKIIVITYKK